MVTGAARAEAALFVIDAREGVQGNWRRHGYLLSMLGIRQIAVVVNKMDDEQIPHLAGRLCENVDELLDASDVIVVGNNAPEFADALARTRSSQIVLDLVRVPCDLSRVAAEYRGLCW